MLQTEKILEGLFRVEEDEKQKAKAQRCKVVCALGRQEREAFLAQVTARLHHLLHHEPSQALLASLRCDGCPALREVLLGSCWGDLLEVCCQHLGALKGDNEKEEEPWPPPLFPCAVRVLYALLKEYSSLKHPPPAPSLPTSQHKALAAAYVALTKALLTPLASGSHALVTSSALWLVLQHLEPQKATAAFLDTLWAVNYLGKRRKANLLRGKVGKEQEKEEEIDFKEEYVEDTMKKYTKKTIYMHIKDSDADGKEERKGNTEEGNVEKEEEGGMRATVHEESRVKESRLMSNASKENNNYAGKQARLNTAEGKISQQEVEANTAKNCKKETIRSTRRINIDINDVKVAIETAKEGEEGKHLMKGNFEVLEESCYTSLTLLLQGMLNAGGKWLEKEEEQEREEGKGYEGRMFLYSLHPLLLKLCGGEAARHTFQAFQTLHLWLRAVRDLGTQRRSIRCSMVPEDNGRESEGVPQGPKLSPLLPHPSQEPLFSMAPGSQGPVFSLLNASWESPAKGVGEMVGRCVEELFSIHEDKEKGAKKTLAKDMMEALLSSSSTDPCSSSSSVWASKSTYPPLALALVHLGCEEALQLHPSLPSSLTYSLGVNHLAPPGTTVYKVFLAQLTEASWNHHFLAPVCEALCSQDKLTQQHVLSLWLPPTLKCYPDIHWALLAPCGSDTPSWLARMAMLRVARSVGSLHLEEGRDLSMQVHKRHNDETLRSARDESLESGTLEGSKSNEASFTATKSMIGNENANKMKSCSEERSWILGKEKEVKEDKNEEGEEKYQETQILHYIRMALQHRDENVRLEALFLLCQTQKTSQAVTPFEAQCLKIFLKHNMNIDSAPFRQGVLKCVAALMVRLRGATASQSKSHAARVGAKGEKGSTKSHSQAAGTLKSVSLPEEKEGNGCDENSTSYQEINHDKPGGKKESHQCSSMHKLNKKSHQDSVNLKRNKNRPPDTNTEETAGKPFGGPNQEEEQAEDEGVLTTSANIVLWLIKEAHRGMAPDANYQRHILALQLYKEVLVALLPSVANQCPGKRSNTSPEALLTYLNRLALQGRSVSDTNAMDVVTQSFATLSHKADKDTKTNNEMPSDCQGYCGKESITSLHSSNQMKSTNGDGKNKEKHLDDLKQDMHMDTKVCGGKDVYGSKQTFHALRPRYEEESIKHMADQSGDIQSDVKPSELHNIHKQTFREPLDIHGDRRAFDQLLIDLKYPWTLTTLLHLAQDEMNDVRTEACEIIHIFASQGKMCLSSSEGKEWMRRALTLCDSPKASDAESGGTLALTVALLLPRQCQREVLEDVFGSVVKGDAGGGGSDSTHPPSLAKYLLARVECQFGAAQSNLLKAAKYAPIHGTLQAFGRCISKKVERREREVGTASVPSNMPQQLASLLQHLVEFVLNTLASTSPLGAVVPPSFAEMGEAVGRVVEKGKEEEKEEEMEKDASPSSVASLPKGEEEQEEEGGLLSSDHTLVLSCCWQILKSCCEVTSQTIHLFTHDPQAADSLIRSVVVRVLLGTRHKGAMEAARASYGTLWASLLQSTTSRGSCGSVVTQFTDILHRQVSEVISSLGSPSHTSVTRRAAGVAMMVQAACGAAPYTTTSLLTTTVSTLTTIASTEVALDNGTTDAPPALALHILQSLVLHSPLGPFLRPHLTPLTACCLRSFSSSSWAIRNAALQLFGSLVSCLVGQKKVRDDTSSLNSLTVPEFFSRHPSLANHLLKALEDDSECCRGDGASHMVCGSLTDDTLKEHQVIHTPRSAQIHKQEKTKRHTEACNTSLSSSPALPQTSLHTMQVISNPPRQNITRDTCKDSHLVTPTHSQKPSQTETSTPTPTPSEIQTQLHTCPQNVSQTHITRASILVPVLSLVARLSPGTGLQQNPELAKTLHRLWCSTACLLHSPVNSVRRLVALALVSLTPSDMAPKQAHNILRKTSDPLMPTNLLNGLLMTLYSFLETHPKLVKDTRLRDRGIKSLAWLIGSDYKCHVNTTLALKIMMLLNIPKLNTHLMPTPDPSLPGAAEYQLTLNLLDLSQYPACTIDSIFLLDPPVDSDIMDGCSSTILSEIKNCQSSSRLLRYERLFWLQFDYDLLTPKAVATLLSFLSAVMEKEESAGMSLPKHRVRFVLSCMEGHYGSQATCAALRLIAHLLKKPQTTPVTLKAFTASITQHSQPTASEDHRLAASSALRVAIKSLLCQCQCIDLKLKEQLIVATVTLLQDEDSAIRNSAADIVVALLTASPGASKMSNAPHQSSPSPHPNLALYELLEWLAKECTSFKDWGILKILWNLCSDQTRLGSSYPVMTLTGDPTRLFQSHSPNLYQEPKQLSIIVGETLQAAVNGVSRQSQKYDNFHICRENRGKSEPIQENPMTAEDTRESVPKNNEIPWTPDLNHCSIHNIHEKEQENSKVIKESQTQQENRNKCTQTEIPHWLEEERTKLNDRGMRIYALTLEHHLWHHRQLATEAGVYVVACRVFQWLCDMFGTSTELSYPLEWTEQGYCKVDGVR